MKQTKGKIYLSDKRGTKETTCFRRYCTFNFQEYFREDRRPLGGLYVFNEETLGGCQSLNFEVVRESYIILIPLVGSLDICCEDKVSTVEIEEIRVMKMSAKGAFNIKNPHHSELISYLQIWINAEQPIKTISGHSFPFELTSIVNQLKEVTAIASTDSEMPFRISLGQFEAREETIYPLSGKTCLFYAFIIAGAFELEGRLLHAGDGLALWNTKEVELEALSNSAMLLVIELH